MSAPLRRFPGALHQNIFHGLRVQQQSAPDAQTRHTAGYGLSSQPCRRDTQTRGGSPQRYE